jgi:thiol:disulfide interchange protein DsbA
MKKFLVIFLAGLVVGCSSEEPASRQAAETAAPPEEAIAEEAAPEEAAPPAPTDEASAAELAQQMDEDESESAGMPEEDEETALGPLAFEAAAPKAPERFQQGRHYELLTAAQPTGFGPDKIEVLELFWYGCPHCYTLEPHIQAWLKDGKPEHAEFRRMPASLNRSWQIHARAYFTAEALGVVDEFHPAMFREMNVNRNALNTPELLASFFSQFGVSEDAFNEAFNSFAVQSKLRRSDSLGKRYRITGVPAIVVNGKYVTGADVAGGVPQLFEVIEFLVQKEASRN